MQTETPLVFGPEHPAFAGHFPGHPIVPGVLLLDAALQAARLNAGPTSQSEVGQPLCQISATKFLSPVGPGEILTLRLSITAGGSTRFDIACGTRKVATGSLQWPPST